jgi:hypothetical protein
MGGGKSTRAMFRFAKETRTTILRRGLGEIA